MQTLRFSSLTSVIGLFVLTPCLAQEPRRASADPFGGPGKGTDDPFNSRSTPPQHHGLAEVTRVNPKGTEPAGSAVPLSSEENIRSELNQKTSIRFVDATLAEAVKSLSQAHQIPILIDLRALEEIGLSSKEPVSLAVKNISLRSALRLLLNHLELSYMIRNEVLLITTEESAEQNLNVRVFQLPASLTGSEVEIVKAVQATVVPDIWETLGGPASIVPVKNTLVVSATETVLEDVASLLEKMTAATVSASSQKAPD